MGAANDDGVTLVQVVRPQGRLGEVLCELLTDFPEQLTGGAHLELVLADASVRPVTIERYWKPLGRNAGRIVLKVQGIDSITAAESLRFAAIRVPRERRVALDDGTFYVSDLVGCHVYDAETLLGQLKDVQFPASSSGKHALDAPALFVVSTDSNDLLLPFAREFVVLIDPSQRLIRMKLPAGLAELNR